MCFSIIQSKKPPFVLSYIWWYGSPLGGKQKISPQVQKGNDTDEVRHSIKKRELECCPV